MNKFVTFAIALILCLALVACANDNVSDTESLNGTEKDLEENSAFTALTPEETSDTQTESKDSVELSLGQADTSIPDAKEYDVITWPAFGIATKIPMPTWSDRGVFYGSETSETQFWAEIGYTTLDDYNSYIKACQDYGYIKNAYEDPDYMYWGENEDGYGIQLTYIPWSRYVGIQVTSNAAEWNKSWEEN